MTISGAKSFCYPALILFILNQQLNKLKLTKEKYSVDKNVLPAGRKKLHDAAFGNIDDYNILRMRPDNPLYAFREIF